MSCTSTRTIMLVEDNADHALLALEAIEDAHDDVSVEIVTDGEQALQRLVQRASAELPTVILLDVKMAGLDGFEVLERLKTDDRLRTIPVVMLTSSADVGDLRRSYELGSNSYVQKPIGSGELFERVGEIPRYWLDVNTAPVHEDVATA